MIKENKNDYNLSSEIIKAINLLNFKDFTLVQKQVIPAVLAQKDVVVKSQTGSGKTAAYAIPICELVDWEENKPQALVLTPTRELAIQVKEDIFNIGRFKRLKVAALYGQSPFYDQKKELKQKTHVVVGTPGRIIDHLDKGTFDTSNIKYLVIDEADEMLNMGFIDQIEIIIRSLHKDRLTMLLSATMPKDIESLCHNYMKNPIHIEIEQQNKSDDNIYQVRYNVHELDKIDLLKDITTVENPDSCIIFCNTKLKVDSVYNQLSRFDYTCKKIHGGMEQPDRLRVMNDFKKGYFRYLVATDVAARGIDIDNISLVINYDIPNDKESYVHRIGRTGRIGKMGRAITFVTQHESRFLDDIERYIGKDILLKEIPDSKIVSSAKEGFVDKMNTRPVVKESKGAELDKEILKLHINAGKKTKMRAMDIVGTLCSIDGMTKDDIGIINIVDISTFVEILNNKGELVFNELQDRPIKGRLRTVSKVEL
ncbi:DEAD/DEAH box helicase [Clostridium lacusfryxellense]|uniref:DEAD/DEAH box helicase n=1 Tax=Clostridium lacusfryxellense TaxID=205328 RepID=UPI001C0C0F25|nr:DEAD/DEAH box helicase [Clostridium lacusfryxellense]MBU3113510.1 DEAD/DEAH box helicase [Clostridium lacusfryxellense]